MRALPKDVVRVMLGAAIEAKRDLRRKMDDVEDAIKESTSDPKRMTEVMADVFVLASVLSAAPYAAAAIALGDGGSEVASSNLTKTVERLEATVARARESIGERDMAANVKAILLGALQLAKDCSIVLLVTDAIEEGAKHGRV